MPDQQRRRVPATLPYAALARGHVDPDTAVELAERVTGQPVRVGTRLLGRILDARADVDGINVTIELEPGVDATADLAAVRSPGQIGFD